jgi:hypothetical protein
VLQLLLVHERVSKAQRRGNAELDSRDRVQGSSLKMEDDSPLLVSAGLPYCVREAGASVLQLFVMQERVSSARRPGNAKLDPRDPGTHV